MSNHANKEDFLLIIGIKKAFDSVNYTSSLKMGHCATTSEGVRWYYSKSDWRWKAKTIVTKDKRAPDHEV